MTAFETATKFFHACEGLQGPDGTAPFVADGATFECQAQPVAEITTVQDYVGWLAGLGSTALAGASYDLHNAVWDEDTDTALFFGTFNASHSGEGGPVPPTGKPTHSHYVYAIRMNGDGKVAHMTKIWNASWSMRELGWA